MKKALARRAAFYLATDVASRVLPFFALPFLAHKMGAEEFGQYSILLTLVNTLSILVGFSSHSAVNIFYFKGEGDWSRLGADLLNFWSLIVLLVVFLSSLFFWHWLAKLVIVAIFSSYCAWVFQLAITVVHFRERVYLYATLQFLRALLLTGFPLAIVLSYSTASRDAFWALSVGYLILLVAALMTLHPEKIRFTVRSPKWSGVKAAHEFSVPLVLNGASGWFRASFDRYVLIYSSSAAAVGIYSLGFQLGSVLGIAGLSISKVSSNYIFKCLSGTQGSLQDRFLSARKILVFFVAINVVGLVLFLLGVYSFFHVFFTAEYEDSSRIAMIVAGGFFLQTYSSLFTPFFQYASSHAILGKMSIFLSLFSAVAVYFLVAFLSYDGAAAAFLAVWLLHAGIVTYLLRRNARVWFVS